MIADKALDYYIDRALHYAQEKHSIGSAVTPADNFRRNHAYLSERLEQAQVQDYEKRYIQAIELCKSIFILLSDEELLRPSRHAATLNYLRSLSFDDPETQKDTINNFLNTLSNSEDSLLTKAWNLMLIDDPNQRITEIYTAIQELMFRF